MEAVSFRLSGKLAHFLRAEAGVNAISYPVPSRTVLLGVIGAVLGLGKDEPQLRLEPACIALRGKVPPSFWHKAKLRKDPPETLPVVVKSNQKQDKVTKPEQATLIAQEWLFKPSYEVWAILPEPYHSEFELRLKERRWYFQPSLGLSEMMADIEYLATDIVSKLELGIYPINTVVRQEAVQLDFQKLYDDGIAVQLLQMPRTVTADRIFTHANYLLESKARPVVAKTEQAYRISEHVVMFL